MSRPLARSMVLVLLAVAVAGVVLEGGLRLAAWLLVARHRHDEPPLATAAIVVYGDSTPYGLGNEVRFSDEIARLAGVVVANRSWPGLNSTQVARIVHDDLATASPRVLVVMAGVNDGWNIEDVPEYLLGDAATWRRKLPRLRTLRLIGLGFGGWSRREETSRLLPSPAVRRIQSASYRSILQDVRARNAEVLFVGYQAEGYGYVGDLADDVLRSEHGDRLVTLRDLFMHDGERRMIQADHFHPTDDGQRAIAGRVLEALRVRGWLHGLDHGAAG